MRRPAERIRSARLRSTPKGWKAQYGVVASRSSCVQAGQRVVGWANRSNALAEVLITRGDRLWEWAAPLNATQAVVAQPLACVIEALARVDVSGRDVAAAASRGRLGVRFVVVPDGGT